MESIDVKELYLNNKDFKEYVDKHCKCYGYTLEDALKLNLVYWVADYYKKLEKEVPRVYEHEE